MTCSVAMATYNGERFLEQQLQSLLEQTLLPTEVVISDDASTDSTMRILTEFAATAPFPVEIHRNESQVGANRNFTSALTACKGDIVFICDQDDFWLPFKIRRTCQVFEENPHAIAVATDAYLCDESLQSTGVTVSETADYKNGACNAYRRPFLEVALPVPPTPTSYDGWLYQLSRWMGERVELPEVHQLWRRHDAALSGWKEEAKQTTPLRRGRLYWLARRLPRLRGSDRRRWLGKEATNLAAMTPRLNEWLTIHTADEPLFARISRFNSLLPIRTEMARARIDLLSKAFPARLTTVVSWLVTKRFSGLYSWRLAVTDLLTTRD